MKDTGTIAPPKIYVIQEHQRADMTPNSDEVLLVSDTQKMYVGDGSTAGGIEAVLPDHLSAFTHADIAHSNRSLIDDYDARQWFDVKIVTSSPYGITVDDDLVVVDVSAGSGAIEINLPAATGSGKVYRVKDIGTDNADVTPNGTDTIDGVNSPVTLTQWDGVRLVDIASGEWIEI